MKYVYHGSSNKILKQIVPNKNINGEKYVYGSFSKAIATIFLAHNANDLYYILTGDGNRYPIELIERKKGMFKKIFNCSGYIYTLKPGNFKENLTGWSGEVLSSEPEDIVNKEYIENVYEKLIELDKEGIIKLYLYPHRPKKYPLDNSDLILKVKRWVSKGYDVDNFFALYPELMAEYNKEAEK